MRRLVPLLGLLALLLMIAAGCAETSGGPTAEKQRKKAIESRTQAFSRAEAEVPQPHPTHFPLRKTLAVMTEREAMLNHPWYVYILGMNGNAIGYYVAKTVPINACDFLSSTEDAYTYDSHLEGILTAPSLDGIYYGGSGASGGCDVWVIQDYTTDALIKFRGVGFYTADQPLRISAEPIKVSGK